MAALRYLAMRDPDLPKIPGVRELAGLTYGRVRTKKVRDMPTQLWMDCGRYPELSKAAKQFPGLPTTSKMLSLSWRDCKEAHDRVYAVRHLLGLPEIMRLVPDYSSPVVQLYSVLTVSLLRKDDVLKAYDWTGDYLYPVRRRTHYPVHGTEHPSILLSLSGLSMDRSDMEAWPSWVPDYGRLSQVMMGPLQQYDPALWSPNFITSTNHVEVQSEPADWRTIHIKGHTFGRIASLLDSSKVPGPRDTDTMSQLLSYSRELFEWFSRCQSSCTVMLARSQGAISKSSSAVRETLLSKHLRSGRVCWRPTIGTALSLREKPLCLKNISRSTSPCSSPARCSRAHRQISTLLTQEACHLRDTNPRACCPDLSG